MKKQKQKQDPKGADNECINEWSEETETRIDYRKEQTQRAQKI